MVIIGAVALIVFGPEQLPKVARRAGQVVRDVQNTSQTFIREMERAADEAEHEHKPWTPPEEPADHVAETFHEYGAAETHVAPEHAVPVSPPLQPPRGA
ncbi:MAG: twin-arginine translocase TatA/TatE family subunit [Candidatus Eremiobacteraeota bacterium]|nr:twin-arginine translocase TatA/TatE family subunit [Candidatus Eremiobacteraeota bacterium]